MKPQSKTEDSDTEDSDTVQAIKPHTHELGAHLQYTENNLAPYHELLTRVQQQDDYIFTDIDVSLEAYDIEITTYQSGLTDNGEKVHGIKVNFGLQDDTLGIKSGSFFIEPRWINVESSGDSASPSIPDINNGDPYFTVDVRGSNIPHEKYLEILQSVFDYFSIDIDTTEPHNSSTCFCISQEVRLDREVLSRLIGHESTFSKITEYVNIDGHLSRSNGDISSRYERLEFGSEAANQLINGHELVNG
jgi:hypothetical protein